MYAAIWKRNEYDIFMYIRQLSAFHKSHGLIIVPRRTIQVVDISIQEKKQKKDI